MSPEHRARYLAHNATKLEEPRRHSWTNVVEEVARITGATSVLDYGSGPARALERFLALPVASYDPGVAELCTPPDPADVVVCWHVLEHCENEAEALLVIRDVERLARRAALVCVSCEPSSKRFPDGTPWHTFVRSRQYWREQIRGFELARGPREFCAAWYAL